MKKRLPSKRSSCPIACALDLIGDKWSLVVLRDMFFLRRRYFQELLSGNEGIASNILASRLKRLESAGMITRRRDPTEPKRVIYEATEMGLDLLPVMIELMRWSMKHDPKTGAPAQFVRRIAEDRDGLIADIRAANKPQSRKGAVSRAAGRT